MHYGVLYPGSMTYELHYFCRWINRHSITENFQNRSGQSDASRLLVRVTAKALITRPKDRPPKGRINLPEHLRLVFSGVGGVRSEMQCIDFCPQQSHFTHHTTHHSLYHTLCLPTTAMIFSAWRTLSLTFREKGESQWLLRGFLWIVY